MIGVGRRKLGIGRRSAAFTLIEALVFLGIWFVVVGFGFALFYRTLTTSKRLGRSADDLVRTLQAGERWRAEMRQATAPPRLGRLPEFSAEVLHIPTARGEVTYAFTGSNVVRRAVSDAIWVEMVSWVRSSEVVREERGGVASWRWELELRARGEEVTVPPLFSFEVVSDAEVKR